MNKLIGLALALCFLLSGSALYLAWQNQVKTAYVDLAKVYSEFQYKKQLEQQLINVDRQAQFLLDSMEVQLNGVAQLVSEKNKPDDQHQFQIMQRNYTMTRQELIENQQAKAQEYDEKIWIQLNQYLEDFADGGGYDYIIGARGDGTIVGGKPTYDLTPQIIHYVNQRYDGKMD